MNDVAAPSHIVIVNGTARGSVRTMKPHAAKVTAIGRQGEIMSDGGNHRFVGMTRRGVLGGLLAGPALIATLPPDQFAPTLELKVNFLRSAKPGRLVGTGRVVHRGGTIAFLAGELSDTAGEVLATATATARIVTVTVSENRGR